MKLKVILLILTTLTVMSCGKKVTSYEDTQNRQYNQYYDEFGLKDLKNDFYSKSEKSYGIYMYGIGCHYCDLCKGAVLDYLDDLKESKNKKLDNLYIFEREKEKDFRNYFKDKPKGFEFERDKDLYIQKMLGATSIEETYFFGTPSLYIIKNHKLNNVLVGDKIVGNYLVKN